MKNRVSRRLLTGGASAMVALSALACETVTEPLPDMPFLHESSALCTGTSPSDTTSTPGDTTGTTSTPLPAGEVETLFSGSQSGIEDERRQIVEDDGAWAAVWSELHAFVGSEPARPTVDFGERRVAVVTSGTRSTGGHRLELVEVTSDGTNLHVAVHDVQPGPGCLTTQEITHPALAISVPRTGDELLVTVDRVYDDCS